MKKKSLLMGISVMVAIVVLSGGIAQAAVTASVSIGSPKAFLGTSADFGFDYDFYAETGGLYAITGDTKITMGLLDSVPVGGTVRWLYRVGSHPTLLEFVDEKYNYTGNSFDLSGYTNGNYFMYASAVANGNVPGVMWEWAPNLSIYVVIDNTLDASIGSPKVFLGTSADFGFTYDFYAKTGGLYAITGDTKITLSRGNFPIGGVNRGLYRVGFHPTVLEFVDFLDFPDTDSFNLSGYPDGEYFMYANAVTDGDLVGAWAWEQPISIYVVVDNILDASIGSPKVFLGNSADFGFTYDFYAETGGLYAITGDTKITLSRGNFPVGGVVRWLYRVGSHPTLLEFVDEKYYYSGQTSFDLSGYPDGNYFMYASAVINGDLVGAWEWAPNLSIYVVIDNSPPVISWTDHGLVITVPGEAQLWPPNHRWVTLTATDTSDIAPLIEATVGEVDELAIGAGGLKHNPDIDKGEDPSVVSIRAERSGRDRDGRVYTVVTTDALGNSTTLIITVPHNQGRK